VSERPDTTGLLAEVDAFVRRYLVLQGDQFYDAVELWILHAHAIGSFDASPRLLAKSPEKESGKTRLLEVLQVLVPNPLFVVNTTIPVIYRKLATEQLTLLHDEADAVWSPKAAAQNEDLRAILNAGYTRSAVVTRIEGPKHGVKEYPVFAATALAAIGNLPDTIESRSIIIPMRRRAPDEEVAPFRRRKVEEGARVLRDALAEWAAVYGDELSEAEPVMPAGVTDRACDIWEPLVAIGDLAGGEWPERARAAAQAVSSGRIAEDLSVGVRLLADIRIVLGEADRMSSSAITEKLNALEEAGWGAWHDGKGMTARDLATRLKPYEITPKDMRLLDGTVKKAYEREAFGDAWARYLREGTTATTATNRNTNSNSNDGFVAVIRGGGGRETREGEGQQEFLPLGTATDRDNRNNGASQDQIPLRSVAVVADNGFEPDFDPEYLEAVMAKADVDAAGEDEG
jgi:hypothetical protein